jgi:hypothetical protein
MGRQFSQTLEGAGSCAAQLVLLNAMVLFVDGPVPVPFLGRHSVFFAKQLEKKKFCAVQLFDRLFK